MGFFCVTFAYFEPFIIYFFYQLIKIIILVLYLCVFLFNNLCHFQMI